MYDPDSPLRSQSLPNMLGQFRDTGDTYGYITASDNFSNPDNKMNGDHEIKPSERVLRQTFLDISVQKYTRVSK